MTGITRVSRESVFSDLNNLRIVTTTSEKYANCFGFTEEEVFAALDEQIVFNQLTGKQDAVWSLLLAGGYLKVEDRESNSAGDSDIYRLRLTNREVLATFRRMVRDWFAGSCESYNDFLKALPAGNLKEMNAYMNRVTNETFSFFDCGNHSSVKTQPERFYHGFVLGLLVDLRDRYILTSNRESGLGRYDVMLEPKNKTDDAFILEFKVQEPEEEKNLSSTVQAALKQIEEKNYAAVLIARNIPVERIWKYGFAFCGKQVLIG